MKRRRQTAALALIAVMAASTFGTLHSFAADTTLAALRNYLVRREAADAPADLNGDGAINAFDATLYK